MSQDIHTSQYYYKIGTSTDSDGNKIDDTIALPLDFTVKEGLHHTKIMKNSRINTSDSHTKDIKINRKKHILLSQLAKQLNKKSTQSLISYESLHFNKDCFEDIDTRTEDNINKQLEEYNVNIDKIDNIFWIEPDELHAILEKPNLPSDYDESIKVTVFYPHSTFEQADWSRYWGDKVIDSVIHMYASVYSDRSDRNKCKYELLDWLENKTKPEHTVARVLTGLESTDEYEVPELRTTVNIETVEDLKNNSNALDTWEKRYESMNQLDNNTVKTIAPQDWLDIITESFGLDRNKPYIYNRIKSYGQKYDKYSLLDDIVQDKVNNATGEYTKVNTPWTIKSEKKLHSKIDEYKGCPKIIEYTVLEYLRNRKHEIKIDELKTIFENNKNLNNDAMYWIKELAYTDSLYNTDSKIKVSKSLRIKINR